MAINSYDQLLDRCNKCLFFPVNQLGSGILKRHLNRHLEYLNEHEGKLFNAKEEYLDFLEIRDGESKYRDKRICDRVSLEGHFFDNYKDPKCRHIFLRVEDSRSPLNCSRKTFSLVLAFHQISPNFLEYLYSFGETNLPLDYSMTGFQSEDTLDVPQTDVLEIPRLGRSGREIRISYLLRSVERSDMDEEWPWKIRQTAVYHSFDMVTGRAFWLNIKSNEIMKKIVTESLNELPEFKSSAVEDKSGAFASTLATHLIFLDWCDGNWRQCINDTEKELWAIINKEKTSPLDQDGHARAVAGVKSNDHMSDEKRSLSRNTTLIGTIRTSTGKLVTNIQKTWRRHTGALPSLDSSPPQKPQSIAETQNQDVTQNFEIFNFSELQRLHHIGERLQEMQLVIKLDSQALRDIKEYYHHLTSRRNLPKDLQCIEKISEFGRRVDRIAKNLEVRLTQIESMITWLNDGKALYDNIFQFRSMQATRMSEKLTKEQGIKMERIANRTEQDTRSMHFITIMTMVFLPGTFVAVRYGWPPLRRRLSDLTLDQTFFQSGLIDWRENVTNFAEAMDFNMEGFCWFCLIAVPITLVIFTWWMISVRKKNKRTEESAV